MSKTPSTLAEDRDTMRPEYDFSGAIRGVTARRYAQGANFVVNEGKIVFLHGINMTWYRGYEENIHAGNFDFAKKNGFGFEMYNFLEIGGRYYGYVAHGDEQAIRLEESLGASKSASSLDGVLAIWTAPCRDGKGREVVGWYRNATLHRYFVQAKGEVRRARTFTHPITRKRIHMGYRVEADTKDGRLLHPDERVLRIPPYRKTTKGVPGISSIYYPFKHESNEAKELRSRVLAFIDESDAGPPQSPRGRTPAWRGQDQERKKRIERAAVEYVCKHFGGGRGRLGYKIESRENDNVGYDLRMIQGDVTLCIEVKGRSTNDVVAEFSRNESGVIKEHERGRFEDGDYRVCIVTDALNEHGQRQLHHFSWWSQKKAWIEVDGSRRLKFDPSGSTIATLDDD